MNASQQPLPSPPVNWRRFGPSPVQECGKTVTLPHSRISGRREILFGFGVLLLMASFTSAEGTSIQTLLAPTGEQPGDYFGQSVSSAGDVNGDGYGDVMVGAHFNDVGGMDAGRAYVYYGGPGADAVADLTLTGSAASDYFGQSVSTAEDVNGDGYGDLIIGAWGSDVGGTDAGGAYVFYGGPGADAVADLVLTGTAAGDRFGISVSAAGDMNGDGFGDVIVGANGNGAGQAYVYYGGPGADAVPDLTLLGAAVGDVFGTSVASAGDVDGDGFGDVIIGALRNSSGGVNAGQAYVYYGGPVADAVADLVLTGAAVGDYFGTSVSSAGDSNGDGYGDVIVGAHLNDVGGTDAGRAYVYYGGAGADAVADLTLTGDAAGDFLGAAVSSAGDVNRDGYSDVVVGAHRNGVGGVDAGRAYVYYGGPGADTVPDLTLTGAATNDDLGVSVASAGDLNGDGFGDVIVGACGRDAGRACVVGVSFSAPIVAAPATVACGENTPIDFAVTASDPDGDAIDALTADLSKLPTGNAATFVSSVTNSSGQFSWTPTFEDAGAYSVTFSALNTLSGSATTTITVADTNRPPIITVPMGITTFEGTPVTFPVSATDPDADTVGLAVLDLPLGATFTDNGIGSGNFTWVPGYSQAGTYAVGFVARDGQGGISARHDVTILISDVNRAPVAVAGGPYSGVVNIPITFNGTGSSDPDGSPLSYFWEYGDMATGAGVTPTHPYATGGTFTVTLTVGDGSLTAGASTIAIVQDIFPARAFTTKANATIRLGSGKDTWCTQVEPLGGSYLNTAADLGSIVLSFGSAQASAIGGKTSISSDVDRNGVDEITACFAKADLRTVFASLPAGRNTVTATLEGNLATGGKFRAQVTVDVVSNGPGLVASLSPNPPTPAAILTFATEVGGQVRVRLFNLQGRLVRTLLPGEYRGPGYHDVHVDGRDDRGKRLPSSVYFYRIEAAEAIETGRFVIAR